MRRPLLPRFDRRKREADKTESLEVKQHCSLTYYQHPDYQQGYILVIPKVTGKSTDRRFATHVRIGAAAILAREER